MKFRIILRLGISIFVLQLTAICSLAGVQTATNTNNQHINLLQRYPTTLIKGNTNPGDAREWEFSKDDIYCLSVFSLKVGDALEVEMGSADVGIGHCVDGAVWAVVIPRKNGTLSSSVGTEPESIDHLWLRFHPAEIITLFPESTVKITEDEELRIRMLKIARTKFFSSWHTGNRAMIPERKDLTVDADTKKGKRRFFAVDTEAATAKYINAFENYIVPEDKPFSKELAESSFNRLWEEYDRNYAMFTLRPEINWEKLREQYHPKAIECKTAYEFAQVCAEMLKHLRDLHIWVSVDGQNVPVFNRPRERNANPSAFEAIIGKLNKAGNYITWGKTAEKVGFIIIDSWRDDIDEKFDEVLENMRDTRGLIIDVRLNGGGSEPLATNVVGRFADKEYIYAYSQYRNGPNHADLTEKYPRKVKPRGPWRYDRPVVLLMGQKCMSSNESFVSMMAECPQVTTMGDHTCGSSGNPKFINLPAGVRISMPRWIDLLPDETPLDEHGFKPDIYFPTKRECFENDRDDLLKIAVEQLMKAPLIEEPIKETVRNENYSEKEIQDLWLEFQKINSAWLEPLQPSMTYNLVAQSKDYDINNSSYVWKDTGKIEVWYTPEKSLKYIVHDLIAPRESNLKEECYFKGEGSRTIPRQESISNLRESEWLAGQIGTNFLTSIHLISWWGLPGNTFIKEKNDKSIVLCFPNMDLNSKWWKDSWVQPTYGCHPHVFSSNYKLLIKRAELEIDTKTLRPVCIKETDTKGDTQAIIYFDEQWLKLGRKYVPGKVRCVLPIHKVEIIYHFDIQEGLWLVKMVENVYETESLSKQVFLRDLKTVNIADEVFDVELPEHSETHLNTGERIITFNTFDGLSIEGKLSMPEKTDKPVPVVFFLPGAGPWTLDQAIEDPDLSNKDSMFPNMKIFNYMDFYAKELTHRGIAFFRVNKRGCAAVKRKPYKRVNRRIFSKATPSILLADYHAALNVLRKQPDIDKKRIVLLGGSEGTILAPRLAIRSPEGIISVVMFGYAQDNTKDTIVWQNTIGPWRTIAQIFDKNNDEKVTKDEFDKVIERVPTSLTIGMSFGGLDRNRDGIITPNELNNKGGLRQILKAVREKDDDYLWVNLLNLSSAYLLEDWERECNHKTLMKLNIPLAIFHGENDGTCRVEGALETKEAFGNANKKNLTVTVYPETNHDLNWMQFLKNNVVPKPFEDIFSYIESIVQ